MIRVGFGLEIGQRGVVHWDMHPVVDGELQDEIFTVDGRAIDGRVEAGTDGGMDGGHCVFMDKGMFGVRIREGVFADLVVWRENDAKMREHGCVEVGLLRKSEAEIAED